MLRTDNYRLHMSHQGMSRKISNAGHTATKKDLGISPRSYQGQSILTALSIRLPVPIPTSGHDIAGQIFNHPGPDVGFVPGGIDSEGPEYDSGNR